MTTPEFIEWVDGKMASYEKLIPPPAVLARELDQRIENKVRAPTTEHILREAGVEDQGAAAVAAIEKPTAATPVEGIKRLFKRAADHEWRDHIEAVAELKVQGGG